MYCLCKKYDKVRESEKTFASIPYNWLFLIQFLIILKNKLKCSHKPPGRDIDKLFAGLILKRGN